MKRRRLISMKRRLAKRQRQEAAQRAAQIEETLRTKLLKDRNGARYWALPQVSAAPAEATTEAAALAPTERCDPKETYNENHDPNELLQDEMQTTAPGQAQTYSPFLLAMQEGEDR